MNQQRNDLELLVQALKGGEKRYFCNFSKAFTADGEYPLYLNLYELLENGNSEVQKNFIGTSKQSLTTTRKRLYGNILKSLRLFHSDRSANISVQNLLADVENLYNLGLANQGLLQLNKAYKLVEQHEKFGLMLQLLDWEKRLNIVLQNPTRSSEAINLEERQVLAKLTQIMTLEGLYSKIMMLKRQYGFVKGELKEQLEKETVLSPHFPSTETCLSNKAIYYRNFIKAIYHWMVFEHDKSFAYSEKLIHGNHSSILPNDFLYGILQHITSCVCLAKFKDTLFGITFAQAFIEEHKLNQSPTFTGLVFAYHATYTSIVQCYTGNRSKIKDIINFIVSGIGMQGEVLPYDMKQVVLGNLMNAYMAIGNYDKVDETWNTMFGRQGKNSRQDIYGDLYLFRLFHYLHEKRYELLPSASLSAQRFFKKSDAFSEVELPIASLLLKERNYQNIETLREVLEEIKHNVSRFIGKARGVGGFQEHYTRYIIWCYAILHDEPYYVAARRWYEGFVKTS